MDQLKPVFVRHPRGPGWICKSHKPNDMTYFEWQTDAERRTKAKQEQKQCPVCKRWFWKNEM